MRAIKYSQNKTSEMLDEGSAHSPVNEETQRNCSERGLERVPVCSCALECVRCVREIAGEGGAEGPKPMTTKRMTKALATGRREATSGFTMRRSDGSVPNTRKMRSARITCPPRREAAGRAHSDCFHCIFGSHFDAGQRREPCVRAQLSCRLACRRADAGMGLGMAGKRG